jgi:hypothetical protein
MTYTSDDAAKETSLALTSLGTKEPTGFFCGLLAAVFCVLIPVTECGSFSHRGRLRSSGKRRKSSHTSLLGTLSPHQFPTSAASRRFFRTSTLLPCKFYASAFARESTDCLRSQPSTAHLGACFFFEPVITGGLTKNCLGLLKSKVVEFGVRPLEFLKVSSLSSQKFLFSR